VLDVIIREVYCKQYLRPTYSEMSFWLFPVLQNTSTFKIEDRLEKRHSVIWKTSLILFWHCRAQRKIVVFIGIRNRISNECENEININ
jgi:hypothetical protein